MGLAHSPFRATRLNLHQKKRRSCRIENGSTGPGNALYLSLSLSLSLCLKGHLSITGLLPLDFSPQNFFDLFHFFHSSSWLKRFDSNSLFSSCNLIELMFLSGFGCCGETQSGPFSRENFKLIQNKIFHPVIKKALQDKIVKGKRIVRKLEDKQNVLLHLEKCPVTIFRLYLFVFVFLLDSGNNAFHPKDCFLSFYSKYHWHIPIFM